MLGGLGEFFGVEFKSSGHGEVPAILDLSAHVEVEFGDEESVFGSGKSWGSGGIRGGDV